MIYAQVVNDVLVHCLKIIVQPLRDVLKLVLPISGHFDMYWSLISCVNWVVFLCDLGVGEEDRTL